MLHGGQRIFSFVQAMYLEKNWLLLKTIHRSLWQEGTKHLIQMNLRIDHVMPDEQRVGNRTPGITSRSANGRDTVGIDIVQDQIIHM